MRIAFVDYVGDPAKPGQAGLSDLVWDMAGRLARLGDDIHVVGPYSVDTFPDQAVQVHPFRLPPIGYRNILGYLLIVFAAYRRLVSLGRMDVIHTPEYLSAAVLGSLMPDTPVVFTEPGNIYERVAHGNPYDVVTTVIYKIAARRAAATCARLVATSAEMAEWWRWTGVSSDRISRVPLGVDTRLFRRVPGARASLGFAKDIPVVLHASRLSRENGVDIVLRAISLLRKKIGPVQFHILGDGPERQHLMELSRMLGIDELATWHGWVDFRLLPQYYSAADVFVCAGLSGGTPRTLLQAMACGAPVVASAIGGVLDHVEHGRTGLLFPPGSSEGLTEATLSLLTQPELARRLGSEAEQYARSHVDWDILVQVLRRDVYSAALRNGRVQSQRLQAQESP